MHVHAEIVGYEHMHETMMLSRRYITGRASSAVTLLRSRWLVSEALPVQTPLNTARPWARNTRGLYTASINSTSKDSSRLDPEEAQPANLKTQSNDQLEESDTTRDMDPQRWQEIASEYNQSKSALDHDHQSKSASDHDHLTDPTLQNQARDPSERSDTDDHTKVHSILEDYSLQELLKNIQKAKAGPVAMPVKPAPKVQRSTMMEIEELVDFLHQENAQDICVISVPPEREYVKYFVTCSGMGTRHIGRMADNLRSELKKVRVGRGGRVTVEGRECDDWMAVDLGTTVVHFMTEDARERYELEKLWTLGRSHDDQYREIEEIVSGKGEDWLSSSK